MLDIWLDIGCVSPKNSDLKMDVWLVMLKSWLCVGHKCNMDFYMVGHVNVVARWSYSEKLLVI